MNDELIYDWLYLVTGTAVIKANQNGPRPSGDFLTWQWISSVPEHMTSITLSNPSGNDATANYQTKYRDTVSIQAKGSTGRTQLDKLISASQRWQARKLLRDSGVTFIRAGDVRDLTQVVDTEFVPVHQVDLEFDTFRRFTETETNIIPDTIVISGEFEDDDGNTYPSSIEVL